MVSTQAIQPKEIVPHPDRLPSPDRASTPTGPLITETNRTQERIIPETVYLTAVDPEAPAEPDQHLHILLINHRDEAPIWLDLLTNNSRFAFICKVVRAHFKPEVCIYGTRAATDPF